MSESLSRSKQIQMIGPFNSLRDYMAALEARGRVIRIKEMDQDKFEATAFAYRLMQRHGYYEAPAFLIERIKINNQWMEGPIIGNLYGGWDTEALAYGVEDITLDQNDMFRTTRDKVVSLADRSGKWPRVEPKGVAESTAPCKEVCLAGDDVDLYQFPWLQTSPGDAGQYINAGAIIVEDPELGRNMGVHRCQVKAKDRIGVNFETGQHGWNVVMAARRRGETSVLAAVCLGVDPISFALSCSKVTGLNEDELEFVGGFKGSPVDLVKCETSDLMVPAQAEMIIEGEIPLEMEEEGPFAEIYGYVGLKKPQNFFMNVHAITHRRNPWFINAFAGVNKLAHSMPTEAGDYLKYKKLISNFVDMYVPKELMGISILSINKRFPGEGIQAGMQVATGRFLSKVVIVVDKDVDVLNMQQVLHAVGSRWQPNPASMIIPQVPGMPLDPSCAERGKTSKIIIDATCQLPQEGGPPSWPPISRVLIEQDFPESFDLVDGKWDEYFSGSE